MLDQFDLAQYAIGVDRDQNVNRPAGVAGTVDEIGVDEYVAERFSTRACNADSRLSFENFHLLGARIKIGGVAFGQQLKE